MHRHALDSRRPADLQVTLSARRAGRRGPLSLLAKLRGCGLDLIAKSLLLGGVADVKVVDTFEHADRAVDQLSNDVGVTSVPLGVSGDVHHHLVQRDRLVAPPPHLANCVDLKLADGAV